MVGVPDTGDTDGVYVTLDVLVAYEKLREGDFVTVRLADLGPAEVPVAEAVMGEGVAL